MCLILFAYDHHPRYHLIFAANRDEFYERPTRPAQFWDCSPDLLAGKDLKGGGTWMGITRSGRMAAVTNYRDTKNIIENAPSRGHLVRDFLESDLSPEAYLNGIKNIGELYNGFNLLVGNFDGIFYYSNRQNKVLKIPSGIHGLSNHLINTKWPKVEKGKQMLTEIIHQNSFPDPETLFSILQDRSRPQDHQLPNTGVSLEWERILSPLFITSKTYGTRSTTLLLWNKDGKIEFLERTFKPSPKGLADTETRRFSFQRVSI